MNSKIILASKSIHRKMLMENAGLNFDTASADIDERTIETAVKDTGVIPKELALILANAKALDVSQKNTDQYVIGSDQTMSMQDKMFHKPENMDDARRRLLELSGSTHELNSAVVIVKNGETIWQHVSTAELTMRKLTPEFIGRHLAQAGDDVLTSVGAYQLEKEGVQLFDNIKGDFFTIVGLPMLPLLEELRNLGVIDG
ncbi:Maf-like protein [Lentilitoribacter sp. Alg239-R112]|jgi:septum formation protein|uniref:Maf-like protein n=1 Tax=Lentilitoribacter sp. Alg239-R112 TaxID=2305987 RepID=UPI0013A6FC91|nr:Maf-like protein [Lentilitoribacter sp. Alg239-R112]